MNVQATIKSPERTSFRIFYITATLFGFILLLFCSALFISKLSVTIVHFPIKSLDDILRYKTHQLCIRDNSYAIKMLLRTVCTIKHLM